jgi:hypothetical protein
LMQNGIPPAEYIQRRPSPQNPAVSQDLLSPQVKI